MAIRNVGTEGLRYRLVDARGEVVGRLASKLSTILQGKDKPTYTPHVNDGDVVVVVNTAEVTLTGRKFENKMYYRHTGYPGGLVERTAKDMYAKDPNFILMKAVERMLPKNLLRKDMMRKLRLFTGPEHDFEEQDLVPFKMPPRKLKKEEDVEIPEGFQPFNPEAHALRKMLQDRSARAKEMQEVIRRNVSGGEK